MKLMIKNFIQCESGAVALEYAFIGCMIFLVFVAAAQGLGGKVKSMYANIGNSF